MNRRTPVPPDRPERNVDALIARWQQDRDQAARDELVMMFLPLARKLAFRYRNATEPLEDLVQIALLGLLGAIDRFDPGQGAGFVSFAVPTMLGEIKRHFRDTGWAAHVPRGAQEMALRVDAASTALVNQTGRSPRIEEIAAHLNVELEDVLLGLEANSAHYAKSLDTPVIARDGDEPQPLVDTLGRPDDHLGLVEAIAALATASRRLPHIQRQVLAMRLAKDMTQKEIALTLGCSQMQVSRHLRAAAKACGISPTSVSRGRMPQSPARSLA